MIPKGYSEVLNRRNTENINIMTKRKKDNKGNNDLQNTTQKAKRLGNVN